MFRSTNSAWEFFRLPLFGSPPSPSHSSLTHLAHFLYLFNSRFLPLPLSSSECCPSTFQLFRTASAQACGGSWAKKWKRERETNPLSDVLLKIVLRFYSSVWSNSWSEEAPVHEKKEKNHSVFCSSSSLLFFLSVFFIWSPRPASSHQTSISPYYQLCEALKIRGKTKRKKPWTCDLLFQAKHPFQV